jgi:hypothetical protein
MQYRRLRAPKQHGEQLVEPPLSEVPALIAANQNSEVSSDLASNDLAKRARSHVVQAAIRYTSSYRDVSDLCSSSITPIIMTGHQPELYHPGVWFKNFLLHRITHDQHAIGINLLIDNDTLQRPAIRVPTGSVGEPLVESVPFDQAREEVPIEERPVYDSRLFDSFSQRVRSKLLDAIEHPLVEQLWPDAIAASINGDNLGMCLSQARHQREAAWGLKTLEVPWSHVCDGDSFRSFVATILARLPQFHQIYNESLSEYRQVNRVRSNAHPVPTLAADGEWLEAPFWLWSSADPTRRRLFVRHVAGGVELTDRHSRPHRLSLSVDGSNEAAIEQLQQLREQGVKLRSRALTTTMFARLFLCDLFIHGIGGAKYDQLTDAIIRPFFERDAPAFITGTMTTKLPIEYRAVTDSELLANRLQLRELRFNPQRHLVSTPENIALIDAKQQWIALRPVDDQRGERYQRIAQLNDAMQPLVAQQRTELLRQREDLLKLSRIDKLLGSREYSFCLFPETRLRPLLLDI